MKKTLIIINTFIFLITVVYSQKSEYSVDLIPENLLNNANAVIRISQESLTIIDNGNAIMHIREVRTILNKGGEKFALLVLPYSSFFKIQNIKGSIYNKNGILIRKVKNNEIHDIAHMDGFSLFTDNRIKYIKEPAENFPYTIEYEYAINFKGILSFPSWNAVPYYNISVETSQYNITTPIDYRIKIKKLNIVGEEKQYNLNNKTNYSFTVKNYEAIKDETFSPPFRNIVPTILISPSNFKLDNFAGNADSWGNFGNWIYSLNEGRSKLTEETIRNIKDLTKDISTDIDKAKFVYEYMQKRTRYVNIALGIGGWQPFETSVTHANGYGDCKALSLYTKSLLQAVGIEAYYTIVNAGEDAPLLHSDFPSNQFNHAILCVPFEKDTVWLECTSQTHPFGFLGNFTDDRDVLLINSKGIGEIAHTTIYPKEVNTQNRIATIILENNGCIKAKFITKYSGLKYQNISGILKLSDEDKEKRIQKIVSIPNLKINHFEYEDDRKMIPTIKETLDFDIQNYAPITGDRIFLCPNILSKTKNLPPNIEKRKSDIVFRRAYTDIDSVKVEIPENFQIEYIPDIVKEDNIFGSYTASYYFSNGELFYVRKHIINKGNYPPEDYEKLKDFFKLIYKSDNQTVVFVNNK